MQRKTQHKILFSEIICDKPNSKHPRIGIKKFEFVFVMYSKIFPCSNICIYLLNIYIQVSFYI